MTNKPTNTASQKNLTTDWLSHQDNINRIFIVFSCIWIILSAIIAMNVGRRMPFHFSSFIGCGIIPIILLWTWNILIHPKSKPVYIYSILWAVIFFRTIAKFELAENSRGGSTFIPPSGPRPDRPHPTYYYYSDHIALNRLREVIKKGNGWLTMFDLQRMGLSKKDGHESSPRPSVHFSGSRWFSSTELKTIEKQLESKIKAEEERLKPQRKKYSEWISRGKYKHYTNYDLKGAWIGIGNRILKYFLPFGFLPIVLAWGIRYIRTSSEPGR